MAEALTPNQIVQWFRAQAKQFNAMADTIEKSFNLSGKEDHTPALPNLGAVTVEQIKKALAEKAQRVADLAKRFSVPPYEIEKLVSNDDVFEKGAQGWIKLKQ